MNTSFRMEEKDPCDHVQRSYARLLDWGGKTGFVVLVVSFLAYATELLPGSVPLAELSRLWSQPLPAYLLQSGAPTGWDWLFQLHRGDFASLLGIAVMAGCSLFCLLSVASIFARRNDHLLATICVLEAAVLLFAASGLLSGVR